MNLQKQTLDHCSFKRCVIFIAGAVRRTLSSLVCNLLLCLAVMPSLAQVTESPANNFREQQLEAITEANEDIETEDDSFLQSMQEFTKNPVNLNTANIIELRELQVLTPMQMQQLVSYRALLGNFIHIYELQAVPGLDITIIEKIRPYVTVALPQKLIRSISERLNGGTNTILARMTQVLEKSKGAKVNPATNERTYPGSRQRLLLRYKYQYKNLLQYGILGEKDAGEQFFKGAQKQGFDFYSAHLFVRNIGIIKSLALGDFTVNLGQGLTQWQSLAFKKGPGVTNIKRQLSVLRPYNSPGEINFHRGLGITLQKNNVEATAFVSYKKTDANFISDTLNNEEFISSLQTSGLHRTISETEDKGVQRQFTLGGNLAYNSEKLHLGINTVQYQFKLPIKKSADPYNLYAVTGSAIGNSSIDYSYTFKNLHFFGEAAITNQLNTAFINGLLVSVAPTIDMSFLHRSISKSYQSLYSNAFTENTLPSNEKGMFAGITIRPDNVWRLDAYADFYGFPWLKYLVDAPSNGKDFMLQLTYQPNKQLDVYTRYRTESKAKNDNPGMLILSPVLNKSRQNIRSHISYKLNRMLTFRNRVEMVWIDNKGGNAENGFLTYTDMIIKPLMKKYSGGIRLQYFETSGYDSRLYAFENDVLYSYSIPVFYDKGFRYYVNFNYDVSKQLSVWLRWAQTVYKDKEAIGSGQDEIMGNKRTEVKLQVLYQFQKD